MEPEVLLQRSQEPPLVPILSQINPVHTTPSYLSKNYFSWKFRIILYLNCATFSKLPLYHDFALHSGDETAMYT
jgi:hypothetical protein